jgi:hypothetical protein
MFEYHVHTARSTAGLEAELEKRIAEGWELEALFASQTGWFFVFLGSLGTQFTMVFRRPA